MDYRYPPEAEAFRQEVRGFLESIVDEEYRHEQRTRHADSDGHGPATHRFVEALRERGYWTMHWPKEYGGQGRSVYEQAVFAEELARVGGSTWIVGHVGLSMAGPALMLFGSDEQKRDLLPKIADGTVNFCQMFTEPEAGSDLAALRTTAIRDGDDYVINGSKVFTTWAKVSTHAYLLARTDPQSERHRGLSLLLMDMNSPGIEVRDLPLVNGSIHGLIHLDNVRVPRSNLIGEENRGWYHAMTTFAFERAGLEFLAGQAAAVEGLLAYARAHEHAGRPLSVDPEVRRHLLTSYRDARIARGLSLKVIDLQERGEVAGAEPSIASLWSRESAGRIAEAKAAVYGMRGQLTVDSPYTAAQGDGARSWWGLAGRHAGGSIEIQKNIIAQRGLGMPR
jgi:alkylation response protein AidB-like acyl-CoA dehydrogenase